MGFLRYECKHGRDSRYLERAAKALDDYRATGNREFLVDAANYVELEWIHPSRADTYFEARDHDASDHDASDTIPNVTSPSDTM